MKISIILPAYNEGKNIIPMYQVLIPVLKKIHLDYEIIWVDDGSRDDTFKKIVELRKKDKKIKCISFRNNFGKAAALMAGFKEAEGDLIITMDSDLQDDPREIPRFIKKLDEGYDLVSGWKFKRRDPLGKTIPSKFSNWLTAKLTGVKIHDNNCGFKAYKKEVTKEIQIYGELHRYIPSLAHWKGFKVGEIKVHHHPRRFGKSKYGIERLIKGFLDLMTVKYLVSFNNRPLHIFGFFGVGSFLLGFLSSLYLLIQWMEGYSIGGRPLLTLSVLLIIMGVQFFTMGFIAEMITNSNSKMNEYYSIKKVIK